MTELSRVNAFIDRLIALTKQELEYEASTTPSITTPSLSSLSRSGSALLNLSSFKSDIGLGGKTIIQLERSSAFHKEVVFPPHDFRPGDVALILDQSNVEGGAGGGKKGKDKESGSSDKSIEGVVYKVLENKILVALGRGGTTTGQQVEGDQGRKEGSSSEEVEIPTRIALLKVSNPSTFLRQIATLEKLKGMVNPDPPPNPAAPTTTNETPPQIDPTSVDATPTPISVNSDAGSDLEPLPKQASTPSEASPSASLPFPPSPPQIPPLIRVLLGLSSPSSSPTSVTPPPAITYFNPNLNSSQQEAIKFILQDPTASEVGLIWGPPGTGKTQTLIEIIQQYLEKDMRILVCGGSNLSVDNILLRLSTLEKRIPVTRIGHPARVLHSLIPHTLDSQSQMTETSELLKDIKEDIKSLEGKLTGSNGMKKERWKGKERRMKWDEVRELRKEYRKRECGIVGAVLGRAKVVLCTTHGAGSRILDKEPPFDVIIIDEAAQVVEPSCWIPILKGKKLILAGDHLQLPPTIKSLKSSSRDQKENTAKEEKEERLNDAAHSAPKPKLDPSPSLEFTLFSRLLALHGPNIRRMLKVQYRFNEKIMQFPSATLYNGELVADDSVKDRMLIDLLEKEETDDEDLREQVVFIDTVGLAMYERSVGNDNGKGSHGEGSKSNENEANLVVKHVRSLMEAGIKAETIAVISPYNAQVSLIASLIHTEHPEVEVGSIDGWQGREQEVVVISLVRSNEKGEVGFLKEKRRLNVAMTRPRRQLVVIGDSHTVKKGGRYLKSWMEWLEQNAYVVAPS